MIESKKNIFQLVMDINITAVTGSVSSFNYYNYYIDEVNFIYGLIPFKGGTTILYTNAHKITSHLPIESDAFNINRTYWTNEAELKLFRTLRKTDL